MSSHNTEIFFLTGEKILCGIHAITHLCKSVEHRTPTVTSEGNRALWVISVGSSIVRDVPSRGGAGAIEGEAGPRRQGVHGNPVHLALDLAVKLQLPKNNFAHAKARKQGVT